MTWYRSIGVLEISFIILFVLFYGAYMYRIIRIAQKLNSPYQTIFVKLILRFVMFTFLIVALLGPSYGESSKEVKSIGKDIFIAVDLSSSMNAYDVQPTRLEKVKFELKNIIDAFNSDRIGIIIFSNEAFVQCPLTYDQNALNLFIETLHTNLVPNAGTDFGPPLQMALDKLTDEETSSSQQKSKIIVLISDGEDFGDDTESVTNDIESSDIKLFTLGVGTERGSKISAGNSFKKDKEGNDVVTQLDPKSLKKLAADTDGQYFEINQQNNDVARLINTINNIEGELRDTRKVDVSANKYFYFLIIAVALLLFDILTSFKTIKI
ncbi:MAG: VWA domain-containing protein [Cyclobacteriaceae bacterium]|nr:VWA domain-containing protein [Cyclobacteriaceae bacterium]